MRILLTNDDSHSSPLLRFALDALSSYGEVTMVVPKHEQSWKGKSLTRFGYVHQESIDLYGQKAFTIDGTPADCVNIGAHHLFSGNKPDLVVAGINAGLNAGTGFVLSSGTVGACLEANVVGVPSIALSQHFDVETRELYIASYTIAPSTLERLHEQTAKILKKVFDTFFANPKLLNSTTTWNVNLPFKEHKDSRIVPCVMGKSVYGNCYKPVDEITGGGIEGSPIKRYAHDLVDYTEDESLKCDSRLVSDGHVTITPIELHSLGQVKEAELEKLRGLFG